MRQLQRSVCIVVTGRPWWWLCILHRLIFIARALWLRAVGGTVRLEIGIYRRMPIGQTKILNYLGTWSALMALNMTWGAASWGIFSESLRIRRSIRLPDHSSIFQAEISSMQVEEEAIRAMYVPTTNIAITQNTQFPIFELHYYVSVS